MDMAIVFVHTVPTYMDSKTDGQVQASSGYNSFAIAIVWTIIKFRDYPVYYDRYRTK